MSNLVRLFKKSIINIMILTVPFLIVLIIILEIFARILLPVSDIPDALFDEVLGNHLLPDQEGVFIKGRNSEIKAAYRINSDGWNSPHDYNVKSSNDIFRIAVIGDSYIEAFQVDYDKSYPYLLEKKLNNEIKNKDKRIEAYTFGHSGANLMQYLAVLRVIVSKYTPDLVIINMVHNDFKESLYGYGRKDNWTLKYDNGSFLEVRPKPVSNLRFKRIMRKSALIRFLVVNLDFNKRLGLVKKIFYADTRKYEANVDLADLDIFSDRSFLYEMLGYLFTEYLESVHKYGSDLLLIMNTNRHAIYSGKDPKKSEVYLFNRASLEAADKLDVSIIDLTEPFEKKWKDKGERFDWKSDGHWNSLGHEVVADVIKQVRF